MRVDSGALPPFSVKCDLFSVNIDGINGVNFILMKCKSIARFVIA